MEEFERRYPPTTKDPMRSFRGAHSWEEVLSVASAAATEYESRSRGIKRFFRNVGTTWGEYNQAIDPILNTLLPSGEYTSLICGA
jgi:hypothetical protein